MSNKNLNVGIVGTQFMGKAHSNAFSKISKFFDLPSNPILHTACGRNKANAEVLSNKFGWENVVTDYHTLIGNEDIDLIDICTANDTHAPIAIAAAKAGKHVLCEKPLARNAEEAIQMYNAVQESGVRNMVIFNYRFVPAIALAKQFIDSGKIGEVRHFNAIYYQDWLVDPLFPMVWRHNAETSGSGAHGDMNAHIVDLARFLVGEFEAVVGDQRVFVKERPIQGSDKTGTVTADDATSFMARFQNGAMGNFGVTRMATGRKNYMQFEVFGSKGSVKFNLERLNELEYFNGDTPAESQGFTNIMVTESTHPYVGKWWPPGHIIGWEHTFIHQISELINSIAANTPSSPDFYDGVKCQLVLDAVSASSDSGKWTSIEEFQRN